MYSLAQHYLSPPSATNLEHALGQAVARQLRCGLAQQALPLRLHDGRMARLLLRLPRLLSLFRLLWECIFRIGDRGDEKRGDRGEASA